MESWEGTGYPKEMWCTISTTFKQSNVGHRLLVIKVVPAYYFTISRQDSAGFSLAAFYDTHRGNSHHTKYYA